MIDESGVHPGLIYQKSDKGLEEIRSRRFRLPKKPRLLLILVDGRTPLEVVLAQASALGIAASALTELIDAGFIEPTAQRMDTRARPGPRRDAEDPFQTALRFMNETVVDALGFRAIFFTMKLERCSTLADLRGLLDSYEQALLKSSEPAMAKVLAAKARSLLG